MIKERSIEQSVTVDHPVNLISASSRIQGSVELNEYSHINGEITGDVFCKEGGTLVVGEQGVVEGKITGDTIIVDGFVRGEINARTKLLISETGRVVGKINAPSFAVLFGGYFDGDCSMALIGENTNQPKASSTQNPAHA